MIWIILFLVFVCVTLLIYILIPVVQMRANAFLQQTLDHAEADIDALYLELQAKQVFYLALVCSVAGLLFGLLLSRGSLLFGFLCGAGGFFLPQFYFARQRGRRREKLNAQLVSAIEMLANALKAGTNLSQALQMIPKEMPAPIAQEFSVVLREMELGLKIEEALDNLVKRVESKEYELVVAAIRIARESGGNLAEVFERMAKTIRERDNMLGKIKSLTAEGKMQGIFVGLLPLFLGLALVVISPETMKPFFSSAIGVILLSAVLILEAMGAYFIKKVITVDV